MKIKNVIPSTIAVVVALAASVCVSQAQLSLQVRFPFTNTDGLTTLQSDTSSGGANVALNMFDNTGTPASFEGTPGSGVSGLKVALDFSANTDFVGGAAEGNAASLGPVAVVTNNVLNFGAVSNYTATVWFNANAQMPNNGGNATLGPRIFVLGTNGLADKAVANSISIYWQQWNLVSASVGATEVDSPAYTGFVPTNQWLFYALTVKNGTNATLYRATDQTNIVAVTNVAVTAANGTLNLTNAAGGVLMVGNKASTLNRSFDGWIDDLRFYTGTGTSNNVEDIRWSAVIPTGFSAISGLNQVNLAWNALGGAASYNVLRSGTSGGPYSLVASGVASPNYSDATVANGNTYYYVVTAVDANGSGNTTANSAEASVFVSAPPNVPTGLGATPGNAQVALSWTASAGSPAAASYNIARSASNGGAGSGGETLLVTGVAGTSYTDTGLTNGITYYYKVSAVSASASVSAYSTEASATAVGAPQAPNILAISQGSNFSVVLKWTDPNPTNIVSIDTYTIQRSPDNASWVTLASGGSATNYTDTTTANANTYYYQILAVNIHGTSVASSSTNITLTQSVTLLDLAEQTVRAAANANIVLNDNNQGSGTSVGFLRVKWVNDATPSDTTSCAKTYFRWNFGAATPDTNSDLQVTWTTVVNNQNCSMILWSLDQPYPFTTGLTGSINADGSTSTNGGVTWNNAQANDTNYNGSLIGTFQMLTNGSFTATKLVYLNWFTGGPAGPAYTVTIPAPWGNLIHNNELVLCLGGTNNGALQSANAYRIANNVTSLKYNLLVGSHPPTMSAIPDMTVATSANGTNSFTITDPDGTVASLTASAAIVSDPSGVISGVTILGSGANEQVVVTASGNTGNATVEVTVTDENLDAAQRTFNVTVVPPILPPTISTPPNTNTLASTPVVVPFTIGDASVPLNTLTVSASVANSGAVLVSAVTNGSGANWTVTVTPVANTNGIGIVNLSVTDPNNNLTTTTSFAVLVRSSAKTVFSDVFDYPSGALLAVDDGVWTQIGPSGAAINVSGGALDIAVNANGNVAFANLLGAPYAPGSHALIYVTFTANWSVSTPFSWLSLAPFGGTSATHVAAVGNVPDNIGGFYATIANNGANAVSTNLQDLALGTTYDVAVRYDVDNAQATLWINATNEVDTNGTPVTANDVLAPASISSIILSQNGAAGGAAVALDDLTISVAARPQVNAVSIVGGNVQITFTAGASDATSSFGMTSTTDLTVPFSAASPVITSLGGGVFQATLPVSGNKSFYRIYRQPFNFTY